MAGMMGYASSSYVNPNTLGFGSQQQQAGPLVDPNTGQLLRQPKTQEEANQAQNELQQWTYGQQMAKWKEAYDLASSPSDTQGIINQGTDELNMSQASAQDAMMDRAAANGAGEGSGAVTQGLQGLKTDFAGKRATLARDVRLADEGRRKSSMLDLLLAKPVQPAAQVNFSGPDLGGFKPGGMGISSGGSGDGLTNEQRKAKLKASKDAAANLATQNRGGGGVPTPKKQMGGGAASGLGGGANTLGFGGSAGLGLGSKFA